MVRLGILLVLLNAALPGLSPAFAADATVLPAGSVLGDEGTVEPREILHDEAAGGRQSDLVALGNLAFASPLILGDPARRAGVACATCHRNGDANPAFFIPGLSDRPGGLAVVNGVFNPRADNGLHRHIDIPSLRGVRFLGTYGRDGRTASLAEFTRTVIVGEFAGPEPAPRLVDAIVAYMQQIDLLPNPRLAPDGRLTAAAGDAARRGEALFGRPFAAMGGQSCASCHRPAALFVDRELHDVGSGGVFRTPTLLGADFTAPYFHDGRYPEFAAVVDHFDRTYGLALTDVDKSDLVAYLTAVGDGEQPWQRVTAAVELDEIEVFLRPLDRALAERDAATVALVVEGVAAELRELQERYPGAGHPLGAADAAVLRPVRGAVAGLVMALRRVETTMSGGRADDAARALAEVRDRLTAARPLLAAAEPASLFDPERLARHRAMVAGLDPGGTPPR